MRVGVLLHCCHFSPLFLDFHVCFGIYFSGILFLLLGSWFGGGLRYGHVFFGDLLLFSLVRIYAFNAVYLLDLEL